MSKKKLSNEYIHGIEKMGYRKSCWAIRPRYFNDLKDFSVYKKNDTSDRNNVLLLNVNELVEYIRNNGYMYNFNCDTCGDKIGQVLAYCDQIEQGLVMMIYHPDDGFTYTDENGRKDHCKQCIKDYKMKTLRIGVFDRRLLKDRAFQLQSKTSFGEYFEDDDN